MQFKTLSLISPQNGRSNIGHQVNLGAAVLLTGAMVPRYLKTHKVWPAGLLSLTGFASGLYEGRKVLQWL